MAIYIGSLFQLCCGEGGTLQTNIIGMCGECSQFMHYSEFAPAHGTCSQSTLLRLQVALKGNCPKQALCCRACRFSGTLQRHRLGRACILCPSQVRAAQATRCLVDTLSQVYLITSLVPATWFPMCAARALSLVCCVSPLGVVFRL